MQTEASIKLEGYAILELFGHSRIAGAISEFVIGGASFVRVDVPEVDGRPAFTRMYGPSAIYSITFTDEPTARRAVKAINPAPITIYIPSERPGLPAPRDPYDYQDEIEIGEIEDERGRCSTCGGDYGPGWTSCTCSDEAQAAQAGDDDYEQAPTGEPDTSAEEPAEVPF